MHIPEVAHVGLAGFRLHKNQLGALEVWLT